MTKPNRRDTTERNLDAQKKINQRLAAKIAELASDVAELKRAMRFVVRSVRR